MIALGSLVLSSPAVAQSEHYPDAAWQVRDVTCDPYPDCTWVDAAESEVVDATTVTLSKPDGPTGTSIETTNLNLPVDTTETFMTVDYTADGDVFANGAVRMFYYDHADADTIEDAPTSTAIADGSGTLSIPIPTGTTIGTMGLTYDASNDTDGAVTFNNLMVGDTSILFVQPVAPSPSPSESHSPTPTPTASNPSAAPTVSQSPVAKPAGLPVTGSSLPWFLGGAAVLIGLGTGLFLLGRRRSPTTS